MKCAIFASQAVTKLKSKRHPQSKKKVETHGPDSAILAHEGEGVVNTDRIADQLR